ncbi:unnamed protein product [Calicophoron daubneyi]|uniref:UNC93-like protein MFSD11 n=1 Tax=Calicophoron daubneyi TaxID=300641 RepID=A0AAV2SZQ2_CALDB
MRFDVNLFNVILTGMVFTFVFTAFQTASLSSQNVLEAASEEEGVNAGTGYISLALLYASFAICNWIAPVVVQLLKAKYTMLLGSFCYLLFVVMFMEPRAGSLYTASLICGFGASIIWIAQGLFITQCSNTRNSNLHFSIFWALFQLSQIIGGLYAYFSLSGSTKITRNLRLQLFGGLIACGALGTLLTLLLRPPSSRKPLEAEGEWPEGDQAGVGVEGTEVTAISPPPHQQRPSGRELCRSGFIAFRRSFSLFPTRTMICLLVAAAFSGVNVTFQSSLIASCIGHTRAFGNHAKAYIGLMGVFIGVGEGVGSGLAQLRRWISPPGLVVLFGYTSALISVFISLITLPADSPMRDTSLSTYVEPSIELCLFAGLLFGVVDSTWNTQISVMISKIYGSDESDVSSAFALFRCFQSVLVAVTFSYCDQLILLWQVIIYVCWATAGMVCFFIVSWTYVRRSNLAHPD